VIRDVDAETHVAYRSLGRNVVGGFLLTVLIHGLLAMLVYQSQRRSAPRPEAVRDVIAEGVSTTYDLGGTAGTAAFGDAIVARLHD